MEDYKKLWLEECERSKQLQLENYRLKKDSKYWRREADKFERFWNKVNPANNKLSINNK